MAFDLLWTALPISLGFACIAIAVVWERGNVLETACAALAVATLWPLVLAAFVLIGIGALIYVALMVPVWIVQALRKAPTKEGSAQ
jgi:hypothetical protein